MSHAAPVAAIDATTLPGPAHGRRNVLFRVTRSQRCRRCTAWISFGLPLCDDSTSVVPNRAVVISHSSILSIVLSVTRTQYRTVLDLVFSNSEPLLSTSCYQQWQKLRARTPIRLMGGCLEPMALRGTVHVASWSDVLCCSGEVNWTDRLPARMHIC